MICPEHATLDMDSSARNGLATAASNSREKGIVNHILNTSVSASKSVQSGIQLLHFLLGKRHVCTDKAASLSKQSVGPGPEAVLTCTGRARVCDTWTHVLTSTSADAGSPSGNLLSKQGGPDRAEAIITTPAAHGHRCVMTFCWLMAGRERLPCLPAASCKGLGLRVITLRA